MFTLQFLLEILPANAWFYVFDKAGTSLYTGAACHIPHEYQNIDVLDVTRGADNNIYIILDK